MKQNADVSYDAGIDWLTVTTTQGDQTQSLLELARELEETQLPENAIAEDWRGLGYRGRSYEGLRVGQRAGGEAILILSGDLAKRVGETYTVDSSRVTRADFQVTVVLPEPDPLIAQRTYLEYKKLTDSEKSGRMYTYISSSTGDTLNVGKRSRNKYLRFYDKSSWFNGAPLGTYWRYEVELKKAVAKEAMRMFNEAENRHVFIGEQVWGAFEKKGIEPRFSVDNRPTSIQVGQNVTTADSKIAWLSRCVAPVVTQLIHLGYEEEVLRSLKLRGVYRSGDE